MGIEKKAGISKCTAFFLGIKNEGGDSFEGINYLERLIQNIPAERYYLRLEGEFNTKFALKTRDGFHTKIAKKQKG